MNPSNSEINMTVDYNTYLNRLPVELRAGKIKAVAHA